MQVALSGNNSQMTDVELLAEFENFQRSVCDLLMSDKGYLAIDFILHDLLAQLEGVVRGKKKWHYLFVMQTRKSQYSHLHIPERETPHLSRTILSSSASLNCHI